MAHKTKVLALANPVDLPLSLVFSPVMILTAVTSHRLRRNSFVHPQLRLRCNPSLR